MGSVETTYWLAGAHIFVALAAALLTPRPIISAFHVVHLFMAMAFGVRPMLAASVGGYTNYPAASGLDAYNYGLLYQLIFTSALSAAYIIFHHSARARTRDFEKVPPANAFYAAFFLGAVAVYLLQVASGGAWLPSTRVATINTAAAGSKYIFPVAIISLSILIPLGALLYVKKANIKTWVLLTVVGIALVLLSLLQVRGMVISGIFLVFWILEKSGRIRAKHMLVGLALVFVLGNVMRPLGAMVSAYLAPTSIEARQIAVASEIADKLTFMDKVRILILYTTNNDVADTWPVAIDYVERSGFLDGRSFAAIPARFASTRFRIDSGYLTGSDTLNIFYYGDDYVRLSFGFNVTLANELYLNFGPAALLLGVIPGFLMWAADTWMRRVRYVTSSALFLAFIVYAYGFTGEPAATIQWVVGALMVALAAEQLTRLRIARTHEPRHTAAETS